MASSKLTVDDDVISVTLATDMVYLLASIAAAAPPAHAIPSAFGPAERAKRTRSRLIVERRRRQ
jgi:hypothetical protein